MSHVKLGIPNTFLPMKLEFHIRKLVSDKKLLKIISRITIFKYKIPESYGRYLRKERDEFPLIVSPLIRF